MLVTALSVAREREQGTFDQLLVTPLRPVEILLGKALPGFIIGLVEATLIIAVAVFWFDVPLRGKLLTLYTGLLLFLLSAIGVGLMISSLAVTQQQGLLGAFLFLVPAVILSGFTTPIANMPQAVQTLTLLNPLRYFMVVLRGVFLEGTPVPPAAGPVLADGGDRPGHPGLRRLAVPPPDVLRCGSSFGAKGERSRREGNTGGGCLKSSSAPGRLRRCIPAGLSPSCSSWRSRPLGSRAPPTTARSR